MTDTLLGGSLGLVLLILFGALIVGVWASLQQWVWKQRGRGFARGWFEVVEQRESTLQKSYMRGATEHAAGKVRITWEDHNKPAPDSTAAPTRDAGHRWLGPEK